MATASGEEGGFRGSGKRATHSKRGMRGKWWEDDAQRRPTLTCLNRLETEVIPACGVAARTGRPARRAGSVYG